MKSGTFENKGVSLNYYQTGEGETDLFVQHGLSFVHDHLGK